MKIKLSVEQKKFCQVCLSDGHAWSSHTFLDGEMKKKKCSSPYIIHMHLSLYIIHILAASWENFIKCGRRWWL